MPADDHVVAHLHQVVDFRPLPDHRPAEARAIHRAARADLHVVLDDRHPDLRHLLVAAVDEFVAKAVGADDDVGVEAHPPPELGPGIEADPGQELAVVAHHDIAAHVHRGLQQRALADGGPRLDHAQRADRGRGGDPGVRGHDRGGMHPGRRRRAQGLLDPGAQAREGDRRLVDHQEELVGRGVAGIVRRHQHDGRPGARDLGLVFGVAQKGQVAGPRRAQRGDAADRGVGRAAGRAGLHDGGDFVGSVRQLHGHGRGRGAGPPAGGGRALRAVRPHSSKFRGRPKAKTPPGPGGVERQIERGAAAAASGSGLGRQARHADGGILGRRGAREPRGRRPGRRPGRPPAPPDDPC